MIEIVTPAWSIPQSVPPRLVSVRAAARITGSVNADSLLFMTSDPSSSFHEVMNANRATVTIAGTTIGRNPFSSRSITSDMIEKFLTRMFPSPDFLFTVNRDFVRSCQTPMLILLDDTEGHPYDVAWETAMLAPKSELAHYPWKNPKELIPMIESDHNNRTPEKQGAWEARWREVLGGLLKSGTLVPAPLATP